MRISTIGALLGLVVALAAGSAARADDIPLPPDVNIVTPDATVPPVLSRFVGKYAGKWDTGLGGILVVESVDRTGAAAVVYAWSDFEVYRTKRGWLRTNGKIVGDRLILDRFTNGASVEYELRGDGSLRGMYSRGSGAPAGGSFARSATAR
ncbi:MAG: hypothetical protein AB7P02_20765 [Alphaproteobacteria bacterium]